MFFGFMGALCPCCFALENFTDHDSKIYHQSLLRARVWIVFTLRVQVAKVCLNHVVESGNLCLKQCSRPASFVSYAHCEECVILFVSIPGM